MSIDFYALDKMNRAGINISEWFNTHYDQIIRDGKINTVGIEAHFARYDYIHTLPSVLFEACQKFRLQSNTESPANLFYMFMKRAIYFAKRNAVNMHKPKPDSSLELSYVPNRPETDHSAISTVEHLLMKTTDRQRTICEKILAGKDISAIANEMNLCRQTIYTEFKKMRELI